MGNMQPTVKLITKRDFLVVENKYHDVSDKAKAIIKGADPLDVLALSVVPGSGLKILDAKVFNEENDEVFLDSLKNGVF
ncbi:MAG: hypothetical protein KAJ91_01500 [Candidatus Aenigmarchaeota archaeon]|nr:hypothetical protein [Candidatus Aenigmarchaeota archaeon]